MPILDPCMIAVFDCIVMAAEVVKHFIPRLVELHNYTPANSTRQKLENWRTLNSEYILILRIILQFVYDVSRKSI